MSFMGIMIALGILWVINMLFRFFANRRAEKQRIRAVLEAVYLQKEGIQYFSLASEYLMRGPIELEGELFRQSIREWIVNIHEEKDALLNRSLPNKVLAQNCDMIDTILHSTLGLTESEAKSLIRNLAKDLEKTGKVLEEDLKQNFHWVA